MSMREAIRAVNRLKAEGLIDDYAIGGGMGAIYYSDTVLTYDLDLIVLLPENTPNLDPLENIHRWARAEGYRFIKEHIEIGGIPVQFLPAYNNLVCEAVREAEAIAYHGQPTRILKIEHLMAIMAQTGRPKDALRLRQLRDENKYDKKRLGVILGKYKLQDRFVKLVSMP